MKKFYVCVLALATGAAVNAQTLTQSNNAPAAADTYTTLQCDSLNISPGASGAGAVWNFSSITIHNSTALNYTVGTAPNTFPAGAVAVGSAANNVNYFLSSAGDLKFYGGNITIQTAAANLTYTSPAIAAIYPMSLNSTSTSAIGGNISITSPLPVSGTFVGNSSTLADGSGTLVLPGGAAGTYSNVLRVVSSQTLNYNATITGVVTKIDYNYYTPGKKAALFTISNVTITSSFATTPTTQTLVTINKDYLQQISTPTSISKNANTVSDLLVYPNPAAGAVNFSTESKLAKEVRLFDITGRMVEKQVMTDGNVKLDVSGYNKGIYIYSLLNADGETLKTGKLTVN